ncbi:DUF3226 domain-containing protein [Delftia acidovorans]|uniref:DUF3226 domain-containing protein n=1 Tax=Delftia acidovorans TaxID=80866 RepID=UPI0035A00865
MAKKTILMVEGKDDVHVVMHICGARELGEISQIKEHGGKDKLLESIGIRVKESELDSLGILLDADTDLAARWDAVTHRLADAGYLNLPVIPDQEGTVILPPEGTLLPRVGVWLMPNNLIEGILEDFLCFLVPEGDRLFEHVERSIDSIPNGCKNFEALAEPKAKIHTWLAWQNEPGKPLGQAISSKYLDAKLPTADKFAAWLTRTFFMENMGAG